MIHADSLKIDKEYAGIEFWDSLKAGVRFPAINGGTFSGVIPVDDPAEIPDPNMALVEIARVINLHIASGIPAGKIKPVIVVHAGALHAIGNNTHYQEFYKMDNPNLKLIIDLEDFGTRFIACGQAMPFSG